MIRSPIAKSRPRDVGAVIFDLDGTVVNSETQYEVSDREFLRRHNIELEQSVFANFRGMGNREVFDFLRREYGLSGTDEELLAEKDQIFLDLGLGNLRTYPAMIESIRRLSEGGVPLALATGSSRRVVDAVTTHLGLRDYFGLIVTGDEVSRGKPDPALFTETASRLSIPAGNCVVVEDSAHGIEAAIRAGMMCVAVPSDQAVPLPKTFYRADLLFPEGTDSFSESVFLSWLEATNESAN